MCLCRFVAKPPLFELFSARLLDRSFVFLYRSFVFLVLSLCLLLMVRFLPLLFFLPLVCMHMTEQKSALPIRFDRAYQHFLVCFVQISDGRRGRRRSTARGILPGFTSLPLVLVRLAPLCFLLLSRYNLYLLLFPRVFSFFRAFPFVRPVVVCSLLDLSLSSSSCSIH